MPSIGWPELLIVLVIALVIFGPKRLPDMGRQLGRGLREFKKATSEIQDHFDLSLEEKDDKVKDFPADVGRTTATTAAAAEASAATTVPAAEASVAQAATPEAPGADAPEVVEGEVVREESDRPAHTVAG
jgi:sec-independent protein translocase protein TatA